MEESGRITELLEAWRSGDTKAGEELMQTVFLELHRIAAQYIGKERRTRTLQPTALVNEAYIRLVGRRQAWNNRTHFFAVAATIMRHVLVDHVRRREAAKRGGTARRLPLGEDLGSILFALPEEDAWIAREEELLALDDALTRLAELDLQQAKIVEMRFFGGLTVEKIAGELQIGSATVKRDWAMARGWLKQQIRGSFQHGAPATPGQIPVNDASSHRGRGKKCQTETSLLQDNLADSK
jgi:RNA polymerase sigma-70 factor (ECF subfamily)